MKVAHIVFPDGWSYYDTGEGWEDRCRHAQRNRQMRFEVIHIVEMTEAEYAEKSATLDADVYFTTRPADNGTEP